MSRIDVVRTKQGTAKVLWNFIQYGTEVHDTDLANKLARQLAQQQNITELHVYPTHHEVLN